MVTIITIYLIFTSFPSYFIALTWADGTNSPHDEGHFCLFSFSLSRDNEDLNCILLARQTVSPILGEKRSLKVFVNNGELM